MIDEKKLIEDIHGYFRKDMDKYLTEDKGDVVVGEDLEKCKELLRLNKVIYDIIKNQPKVGEWIPCSERLPEGCDDAELEVLVHMEEKYIEAEFKEVGLALYYPGEKQFRSVYNHMADITENVVAWMPLPEPYREE